MKIPVRFREGTIEDKSFVLSAWMRGLRQKRSGEYTSTLTGKRVIIDQGSMGAFMPHDLYFKRFRPLVEDRVYPKSNILIAHNPEDPDQIYGFMAYRRLGEVSVMSFCYVKLAFRKFGVARELFEMAKASTNVTTYHAPWLDRLLESQGVIFDPFFDLEL